MNYFMVAAVLILSAVAARAQSVAPLEANAVLVGEVSRHVATNWKDEKTWSGFEPIQLKWSRTADGVEVISAATTTILVDNKTYLHYRARAGTAGLTETFSQNSSRQGEGLESGAAWAAARTYAHAPASWCADPKAKFDSKFEVGVKEPYTLLIAGKETTIEVVPVVERGWWTKCVSGKRYTRLLVSRDLGAVVSIEHIGYTQQGQVHESSYRLNVKELKLP